MPSSASSSSGSLNTPTTSGKKSTTTTTTPNHKKINHTKNLFDAMRRNFTPNVGYDYMGGGGSSGGLGTASATDDPHQVLSTSEISRYRDAFESFAHEETDSITLTAIDRIMRRMFQEPNEKELMEMIREVDENGDKEIDFDEFLILIMQNKKRGLVSEEELNMEAFHLFDRDEKGFIDAKDLLRVFTSLTASDGDHVKMNPETHLEEPITLTDCEFMIKEIKGLPLTSSVFGGGVTEKDLYLSKADFIKLFRMKPGQEPWAIKNRDLMMSQGSPMR